MRCGPASSWSRLQETCQKFGKRVPRPTALVLNRVVQKGGNRLILAASVLQNERRHAEKVTDVGFVAPLALLVCVQLAMQACGLRAHSAHTSCRFTFIQPPCDSFGRQSLEPQRQRSLWMQLQVSRQAW